MGWKKYFMETRWAFFILNIKNRFMYKYQKATIILIIITLIQVILSILLPKITIELMFLAIIAHTINNTYFFRK